MSAFFDTAITKDNLKYLCYTNKNVIKGEIKGVVTDFHGFGCDSMKDGEDIHDTYLAEHGILTVFPFYSPWAWANENCVEFCDKIIDLVYEENGLSSDVPLAISGDSMGGMTALEFSVYTKHKFVSVAANCPVCDLDKINLQRIDIIRAICSAYGAEGRTYEETLKYHSPLHHLDKFKKVPYILAQGGKDDEVNGSENALVFVPEMKKLGHDITLLYDDDMTHCSMPANMHKEYYDFIINTLKGTR